MDMAVAVIGKAGFTRATSREALIEAFNGQSDAVREGVPEDRLLVYDVREGWEPLCRFLGLPVPAEEFPHSNSRADFWERLKRA